MKWDWFPIDNAALDALTGQCPVGEYRVISPSAITLPLPQSLTDKCDSIFLFSSGNAAGDTVHYMANLHRVDKPDMAIDQQPFGFILRSDTQNLSGCLIHHGEWDNRTTHPPPDFWQRIQESGIGTCFQIAELPSSNAGKISDITIDSQLQAFQQTIDLIRNETEVEQSPAPYSSPAAGSESGEA